MVHASAANARARISGSVAVSPGLAEVSRRYGVAELVFGISKLEQDRWSIGHVWWLVERPAQVPGGGVGRTAGKGRSRGLTEHRDDVGVPARRRRDQVHRDRTRVGPLVRQKLGRTRV